MTQYKVLGTHLPEDLHDKLHGGKHEGQHIVPFLHDHISENHPLEEAYDHDNLEAAQRSARWNSGHTKDGIPATPVVAHVKRGRVTAYSWKPDHHHDWLTHPVNARHGKLRSLAEIDKYDEKTHRVPDVSKEHVDKITDHEQNHGLHESHSDFHQSVCNKAFGCDNNDSHPMGSHYFTDHYCDNHKTFHADSDHENEELASGAFHASRHNRAHTDWDLHSLHGRLSDNKDNPKGDIHRGVSFHLPHDTNTKVHGHKNGAGSDMERYEHNTLTPKKKIAEALLKHASGNSMGMHWSSQEDTAKDFSDQNNAPKKVGSGYHQATQVIFHAKMPHKDHIEKDGYELAKHGVYSHDHDIDEKEVPIKRGGQVHVTGVSWKHANDTKWNHYGQDKSNTMKSKDIAKDGLPHQHEAKLASQLMQKHSTMVAIHPPRGLMDHILPKRNPESLDKLHLTLLCLEDGHDEGHLAELPDVVHAWAEKVEPLELKVGGVGTFINEDKHVLWASVDHPDLHRLHESLAMTLEKHGYNVKQDYGFTPHITLGYGNTHYRFLPKLHEKLPFSANDVMVHVGDQGKQKEIHQIPLGKNNAGT